MNENPPSSFSGKLRLCDGTHAEAAVTKKKRRKEALRYLKRDVQIYNITKPDITNQFHIKELLT